VFVRGAEGHEMLEITESLFEKSGELSLAGVQVQATLGLIIGLGFAVSGYKLRRFWLVLLAIFPGLLIGGTCGLSLHILYSVSSKFSAMVASTVFGGMIGAVIFALLGYFLPRFIEALLVIFTCLLAGSLLQDILQGTVGPAVLFCAVGLLIFGLSLWAHRPVLIVISALFGSMLFIQGLAQMLNPPYGALLAEMPIKLLWADEFRVDVVRELRETIAPGYRFYFSLGFLVFLLAMPLQFILTRDRTEEDF